MDTTASPTHPKTLLSHLDSVFESNKLNQGLEEAEQGGDTLAPLIASSLAAHRAALHDASSSPTLAVRIHRILTSWASTHRVSSQWKNVSAGEHCLIAHLTVATLQTVCDELVSLEEDLDEHISFWRHRTYQHSQELIESLPSRVFGMSPYASPSERVLELQNLRAPLLVTLGRCHRQLACFLSANSPTRILELVSHTHHLLLVGLQGGGDDDLPGSFHASSFLPTLQFFDSVHARVLPALRSRTAAAVQPLRRRSLMQQKWLRLVVIGGVTVYISAKLFRNRSKIPSAIQDTVTGVRSFVHSHIVDPMTEIFREVTRSRPALKDLEDQKEAKESLARMLSNYMERTQPSMSFAERSSRSAALDMKPTQLVYEKEIQKPIRGAVSGSLIENMLIQVQFIKTEVFEAKAKLNKVMNDNQFNMQIMTLVPALGFLHLSVRFGIYLKNRLTHSRPPTVLLPHLRLVTRNIGRLITLTASSCQSRDPPRDGALEEAMSPHTVLRTGSAAAASSTSSPSTDAAVEARDVGAGAGAGAGASAGAGAGAGTALTPIKAPSSAGQSHSHSSFFDPETGASGTTDGNDCPCPALNFPGMSHARVGELVVLLRYLRKDLELYRSHLSIEEWIQLEEDVHDLSASSASRIERSETVQRMMFSYAFLQPATHRGLL